MLPFGLVNMLFYYLRMFVQNVCCILSRILSQNVCSEFLVVFYPEFYFRMLSFCSELFCLYSEFLSQNVCLSQNFLLVPEFFTCPRMFACPRMFV